MSAMRKKTEGMIDISDKAITKRTARASAKIKLSRRIIKLIKSKSIAKGDALEHARIAGVLAAKKTYEIIPLCHPIPIENIAISFKINKDSIAITSEVISVGRTGVEMEALTAVSVSALTIYDMCKMYDSAMEITDMVLLEKKGGRSGHYRKN